MKLRAEDLNHRRREERKPAQRSIFWRLLLLLLFVAGAGYILYEKRDVLPPSIAGPIAALVEYVGDIGSILTQRTQAEVESNQNDIVVIESIVKDFVTRAELQELINANFATLITKVDKLQQDVEYVGGLGRSLTRKVDAVERQMPVLEGNIAKVEDNVATVKDGIGTLEAELAPLKKGIETQGTRIQVIGTRLEEVDTLFQAEAEKIGGSIRAIDEKLAVFNRELETLKRSVSDLRSTSDAQQRSMNQLEQTVTILNARLIELER